MNILIADDEEKIRQNFVKRIIKAKLPVTNIVLAANGNEAITCMHEHDIDVALIDINMPFKNGLDLIHEIRQENEEIILIIISGYNDFHYAQQALAEDVFRYLLKPVDSKEFINIISLALQKASEKKKTLYSANAQKILDEIQKNISNESYSLTDLAEALEISEGHITKLIKKELSKSFIDILTELRINYAKQLIRQNSLCLKMYEIAEACGYSNQYYFSQMFKKVVGVSPKQYSQNTAD